MVITLSGQVYSFGLNMAGQLGLGHFNNVFKPNIVEVFYN